MIVGSNKTNTPTIYNKRHPAGRKKPQYNDGGCNQHVNFSRYKDMYRAPNKKLM